MRQFDVRTVCLCGAMAAALTLSLGCAKDNDTSGVQSQSKQSKQVELSAEDRAGKHLEKGDRVKAPFGNATEKQGGKVIEAYGKLAKIQFFDRHVGWAHVKAIEPVGAIVAIPSDDTCAYEVGDEIRAPWSYDVRDFKGTIDEVYGKVAHIQYADGDEDWMKCERMKPPKKVQKRSRPALARSGGESSNAEAVRQCQRGCNPSCRHVTAKATCVAKCRRRCAGKRF